MKRRTLFSFSSGLPAVPALLRAVFAVALFAGWPSSAAAAPGILRNTITIGTTGSVANATAFDTTDDRFVFVTDSVGNQVSILDRWRYEVRSTFNLLSGCQPSDLVFVPAVAANADQDRLYVSCPGIDKLEILDASGVTGDAPVLTRVITTGLLVGDSPGPLAYHGGTDRVLVANQGTTNTASVVDNSLATPIKTDDVPVCTGASRNGIGAASGPAGRVYVTCGNSNIDVIDGLPAAPAYLTTITPAAGNGFVLNGFIPYEITALAGDYLYVAYSNAAGTDTGFVVIKTSDNTLCSNRQTVGAGASSMTAFADLDNSPDDLLGFLTISGAVTSMVYVTVNAVEAGACPAPGPPGLLTAVLTLPAESPTDTGRRKTAYSSGLMVVPSRHGYLYSVSSAPLFVNDTTALPMVTYNNLIGSDPVADPTGIDGDKPFTTVTSNFTLAASSNLNLGSVVLTLYPTGDPISLSPGATVDGGSIVINSSDLAGLSESQVIEIKVVASSNTTEPTTQLLRVARLDIDRPAVPQAPKAISTGLFVAVDIPKTDDTCPLAPPADCTSLESGTEQIISGVSTYIVRVQSSTDPAKVFITSVDSTASQAVVDVSSAGLGLTESWLAAVATRDTAGNRSLTYSYQTPSTLLRVGSQALFGEPGGFGCTAGDTSAPLMVPLVMLLAAALIHFRRRKPEAS